MTQVSDMSAVRKKFEELIDAIPVGDDVKKSLKDFFLTKTDAELHVMIKMFLDNFTWVRWYWRLKGPRK